MRVETEGLIVVGVFFVVWSALFVGGWVVVALGQKVLLGAD